MIKSSYAELGFDILIEINGVCQYNKSEIFKLANTYGSLKQAWEVAKQYKKFFDRILEILPTFHTVNDHHSEFLATQLSKHTNPLDRNYLKLRKHALIYNNWLNESNPRLRDNYLLQCFMSPEYFLEYLTKQEFMNMLHSFCENTVLIPAEYEKDIEYIKILL